MVEDHVDLTIVGLHVLGPLLGHIFKLVDWQQVFVLPFGLVILEFLFLLISCFTGQLDNNKLVTLIFIYCFLNLK